MTESSLHFIGGRIAGPYAGATGEARARALLDLARSVVLGGGGLNDGGGLDGSCQPREAGGGESVQTTAPLSLRPHLLV